MSEIIVIAIDPGPSLSAFVIWNGREILQKGIVPSEDILTSEFFCQAPVSSSPTHCVIENVVSYGMPVGREVFETCRYIGRYEQRWENYYKEQAHLVSRLEVKLHHCHSPKAGDPAVRQALLDRFGPPGTKHKRGLTHGVVKDMWSAFAIATYFWDTLQEEKQFKDHPMCLAFR
jgi:hypothetical protein